MVYLYTGINLGKIRTLFAFPFAWRERANTIALGSAVFQRFGSFGSGVFNTRGSAPSPDPPPPEALVLDPPTGLMLASQFSKPINYQNALVQVHYVQNVIVSKYVVGIKLRYNLSKLL